MFFFSKPKEPAFFNSDYIGGIKSENRYLELFNTVSDTQIAIGEGTTIYLYSDHAIQNILKMQPEAKFIICLRNPIDMAVSMHSERVYQGEEPEQSFEVAWNKQNERHNQIGIPLSMKGNAILLQYKELCKHSRWVEKIFSQVSREKVLILLFEELKTNPRGTFDKVCDFLNLSREHRISFDKKNSAKQTRSVRVSSFIHLGIFLKRKIIGSHKTNIGAWLRGLNTYSGKNKEIPNELRRSMLLEFTEDITRLEKLLGRNLDSWKN